MKTVAGGKEEVEESSGYQKTGSDLGKISSIKAESCLRQGQKTEKRCIDRQPLQNKMAGDKHLKQKHVENAVDQNRRIRWAVHLPA